jgi:hypothetical protein
VVHNDTVVFSFSYICTKVLFFSSVAHVWVPGAKTTGSIVFFFLNLIFMSVRNLRFNAIHSVIKTYVSQRSSCRQWGLPEMAYFILGYFLTKLGSSVDGHEKIII